MSHILDAGSIEQLSQGSMIALKKAGLNFLPKGLARMSPPNTCEVAKFEPINAQLAGRVVVHLETYDNVEKRDVEQGEDLLTFDVHGTEGNTANYVLTLHCQDGTAFITLA